MKQYYHIAGLTVEMDSFGYTVTQAQPYLLHPQPEHMEPDITIRSDWKTLKEQQPHLSEADCEYLSTGGSFYRQLLRFDGLLLHASAVVVDGRAYLFSAPCGTGKSTHVGLWRQRFGDEVTVINDDKPAIVFQGDTPYLCGTPWSGKTALNNNE